MKPRSAKAKGRKLQQEVAAKIRELFGLHEDDVRPAIMGESGEDIKLSSAARAVFPYSVECKNTERLNVWDAWAQAQANATTHEPLLVFRRNRSDTLCVIRFEHLLELERSK